MTRRTFAALMGAAAPKPRPNVLWITCEDTGPQLGCYGDRYAVTPNLDRFASGAVRYRTAWSNAPVCAPARTTIISGMYPPATGSENMRSMTTLPAGMRMYPCYLRDAGYYVSNNVKEDYNLEHTGRVWDDSSKRAHWRNRATGQPFFSIFNLTITHESQIRARPHTWVHDPARAPLPAYHPDIPEVRQDWAQYYDNVTTMDREAGEILRQLEADGLERDTIVFFYGDHGSGMPRSKRWPYNSGLRVPLLVRIPERFRHLAPKDYAAGGVSGRLVSFVDLGPTLLSLCGVRPPAHMHGHAFMGEHEAPEQSYLYGFRGRMDERYDLVRSVRDRRYVYLRQYMPHRTYGEHLSYMFETPTTRRWKELYDQGKLKPPQTHFWETKPAEELYDLEEDPDEVRNLASSPRHQDVLRRLRQAQQNLAREIRDVGFLPECEVHSRSKGSTPYQMGHNPRLYPMERVMSAAEGASRSEDMAAALRDPDSAVRYWGVLGLLMRRQAPSPEFLRDPAPAVRIAAAEALARYGGEDGLKAALPVLADLAQVDRHGTHVALLALNSIDVLGSKAAPLRDQLAALKLKDPAVHQRFGGYPNRLVDHILKTAR